MWNRPIQPGFICLAVYNAAYTIKCLSRSVRFGLHVKWFVRVPRAWYQFNRKHHIQILHNKIIPCARVCVWFYSCSFIRSFAYQYWSICHNSPHSSEIVDFFQTTPTPPHIQLMPDITTKSRLIKINNSVSVICCRWFFSLLVLEPCSPCSALMWFHWNSTWLLMKVEYTYEKIVRNFRYYFLFTYQFFVH